MKTAEAKTSATTARQSTPFFNKGESQSFFVQDSAGTSFFSKPSASTFIQPKLSIGRPGDKYEQEADAMADQVVQRLSQPEALQTKSAVRYSPITPAIQPKCAACDQEEKLQKKEEWRGEEEQLQRKPIFESNAPPPDEEIQLKFASCEQEDKLHQQQYSVKAQIKAKQEVPVGSPYDQYEAEADTVAQTIIENNFVPSVQRKESDSSGNKTDINENSLSSGGSPLGYHVQAYFEDKMGYDFSDVRVHTGQDAIQKSEALNAHAFTYGNHIWLNEGQRAEPSFIMAHEMAHVVQQTQPATIQKTSKASDHDAHLISSLARKQVQRFIFWNEYVAGGRKNRKGQDTHHELENAFAKSSGIQKEIWIPNGNSSGKGYGFKGRPDLYKSSAVIGVSFNSPAAGAPICSSGDALGQASGLNSKHKGRRPSLSSSGRITQIDTAPSEITVGDLKPAENSVVATGKKQVNNYVGGIEFARDQVNCWSDHNPPSTGSAPHWGLSTPKKFENASLPIPHEYQSAGAGTNRNLGISNFNMVSDQGNFKPKTEKLFSPHDLGISIQGSLLAMHVGEGVVVYYYQPSDLAGVVRALGLDPRAREFQEYAKFATQLQNMVITPLLTAPKKVNTKCKQESCSTRPATKVGQKSPGKAIQAKKKAKLIDDFKLGNWRSQHQQHQNNFKHKDKSTRDRLQFAGLIYEAEANLKKAGAPTPSTSLPPRSQFDIRLGRSPGGKVQEQNLTTMYSWMDIWAKEPIKYLGTLRSKFGTSFVKVSNKINSLKAKLDKKLKQARKSNTPSGTSYADIAVRAFWRALVKAGGLVFENTIQLLMLSLESGLKNKMAELIPLEGEKLNKMVEEGFPELRGLQDTIERLENDFDQKVDEVVAGFDEEIEVLKKAADQAKRYGKYIKWAMVAIQCGTPPGWGCLKLLAQRLIATMINEILEWCWTQKKFAGLVVSSGVLDNIPKELAVKVADVTEAAVPGMGPIFDRTIFEQAAPPEAEDIPCDEEITEEHKAMVELEETLQEKLGTDGYLLFLEATRKYGIKPDEEFTADQIREIRDKIPDDISSEELMRFIASNPKPKHGEGKVMDIGEFLIYVKSSQAPASFTWYFVAHPPAKGHTKGERVQVKVTISPYQPHTHWSVIKELNVGAKVVKRDWFNKKYFKIDYQALQDVRFELGTEQKKISEGEVFPGYRPDPFF